MFHPRSWLASSLLLLSLGPCALSACFLSQEDQILNIPPQRNRPPRIMEELGVQPNGLTGNRRKVTSQSDCEILQFDFQPEDPDIADTLKVAWYVDYPLSTFPALEQGLTPTGQTIRERTAFSVDLTSALQLPASFLQQPGTHVVEALLYDWFLDARRQPIPIDPALDGGIPNPSYVVSYAWVVEVTHACPLPPP